MKRILPLFILVLSFILNLLDSSNVPVPVKALPLSYTAPQKIISPAPIRLPAQIKENKNLPDFSKIVQTDPKIKIAKGGYVLAVNIGAVAKSDYRVSMGKIIFQDKSFNYFQKNAEERTIPVVYDHSRGKFYPVSSILNLKNISPEVREQLLNEGFHEYHYMQNLKYLFIQADADEVLKSYEQLKLRGYKVELEALTETPKSH